VWDIHSLQRGFASGGQQIGDYHGFLGARPQLVQSLRRIRETGASMLVPSHGRIMPDPPRAVDALIARLDACYDQYVAISALRFYYPKLFTDFAGRKGHMPLATTKPAPPFLRHFGTSWVLISQDKAGFAMDCGGKDALNKVRQLVQRGELTSVEGLWITHYHDDHVDFVPEFLEAFKCPCITDAAVAQVISDPLAWRIPCISPKKARVDRVTRHGETWQWHEFTLTAYHFPGQTLYHSGLLVEGQGTKMLFVGDSFTPGGIDDYCALNRNWIGGGVGFDRCIALIEELKPTHIFNCHVDKAFVFTAEECRFMRDNLASREQSFGRLVPWDHVNYGMDEPWVRCHPYEQQAGAGEEIRFDVVVTNHSPREQAFRCRAVIPRAWGNETPGKKPAWGAGKAAAKADGRVTMTLRIPAGMSPGRHVIPVDLRYGDRDLPQAAETIIVV
jgi:glyoxylase-like metal-dependent hydrolase (beta-lactamase superfamily II)